MRTLIIVLTVVFILIALMIIFGRIFSSRVAMPAGVGVGTLAPCPAAPNCVSTEATDDIHQIKPIELDQSAADAINMLATILTKIPKSKVITQNDGYLHVELRSPFWNFIDDVEFLVDEEKGAIESRSAARTGYSDLGANKDRYRKIVEEYKLLSR